MSIRSILTRRHSHLDRRQSADDRPNQRSVRHAGRSRAPAGHAQPTGRRRPRPHDVASERGLPPFLAITIGEPIAAPSIRNGRRSHRAVQSNGRDPADMNGAQRDSMANRTGDTDPSTQ